MLTSCITSSPLRKFTWCSSILLLLWHATLFKWVFWTHWWREYFSTL